MNYILLIYDFCFICLTNKKTCFRSPLRNMNYTFSQLELEFEQVLNILKGARLSTLFRAGVKSLNIDEHELYF